MEWITQLQGKVIGLDTAPLIYFIERNPMYLEMIRLFFRALNRGEFMVVTSTITVLEVLVQPLRRGDTTLVEEYRDILFNSEGLTTIEVSPGIAEAAAQLRAVHNLRPLDAIQLATSISEDAEFFLTNDTRLPSLPGLQMLVLEQLRV